MATKRQKKRNKSRAGSAFPIDTLEPYWREHLAALSVEMVEDYLAFCRVHRFAASLNKTQRQLRLERQHAAKQRADESMYGVRRVQHPERVLRRILQADHVADVPRGFGLVLRLVRSRGFPAEQGAFARELLQHILDVCPDLPGERMGDVEGWDATYLQVLVRLTGYHDRVLRSVSGWRPRTHNARRRVTSLVRHLFASFAVPEFLDAAWFEEGEEAACHREWFLHIGRGRNIRTTDLPIPYTKRMAHHFLAAPADYTVVEAVRFGQVLGMGGDAKLVRLLRQTRLCRGFESEEFWATVLRFFIRNPGIDPDQIAPIVDYLQHERFATEEVVGADGVVRQTPPPQPGLSMRGRTPRSLLKQVEDWHRRLGRGRCNGPIVTWPASGFPAFRCTKGETPDKLRLRDQPLGQPLQVWTIREHLSSAQLELEGSKMIHCVASYVSLCVGGDTSIWTMECEEKKRLRRVLTIEVSNRIARIVQARGKRNRRPRPEARAILLRWVRAANLTIADWV